MADARLHREVGALQRAGLVVEVLATGDPGGAPTQAAVRTWPRVGPVRRAMRSLSLPWRARGRVILTLDPDLVPSAFVVSRLRHRLLVVDVHEDYVALLSDRRWASGPRGWAALRVARWSTALARRADLTVVADDQVPPLSANRRLVLRNVPDPALLPEPGERQGGLRAVYVGDLRESRGLFDMLSAVALAPAWSLDLVGPVAPADRARLTAWMEANPAADRVRLHGRRPPLEAWRIADGAAAGLILLHPTPAFLEGVPSKLYEYLACGLAVVASPLPRQAELLTSSGAGVIAEDCQAAGAVLQGWTDDPADLDRRRAAARAWARENSGLGSAYGEFAERLRALVTG